jgi:hypothetical protein
MWNFEEAEEEKLIAASRRVKSTSATTFTLSWRYCASFVEASFPHPRRLQLRRDAWPQPMSVDVTNVARLTRCIFALGFSAFREASVEHHSLCMPRHTPDWPSYRSNAIADERRRPGATALLPHLSSSRRSILARIIMPLRLVRRDVPSLTHGF